MNIWYTHEHSSSELYDRDLIRSSKRISNPGCYATSTQLLIAPLVKFLRQDAPPTVFGVSGYSGAGTTMEKDSSGRVVTKPKVSPELLHGGIKPYSITGHIHEREAGYHLSSLVLNGQVNVGFIPVVGAWFSGIISTGSIPLKEKLSARDVVSLFEEKYGDEKLICIQRDVVQVQDVQHKHGWRVGGFQMSSDGERVVLVGGLDNLLKGAATQCLQVGCSVLVELDDGADLQKNLNLALGYDEYTGIPST